MADVQEYSNERQCGAVLKGIASGAGTGATAGAALGTAVPGIGNIVGGVAGAILGGIIGGVSGGVTENAAHDVPDAGTGPKSLPQRAVCSTIQDCLCRVYNFEAS
jgi:phage tail tape-measure protein